MIKQILAVGGLSIGISLMPSPAAAQVPQQPAKAPAKPSAQKAAAGKKWTPPRTPWGEPDLQGMWPLNHLISTPFQRAEKYGNRRFLTEDELAAAKKSADARNKRFESGAIPQADSGTAVMQITSLLSDPPNGRFPALTPKGKELYDKMHGSYKPGQTVFDSPDDFDSWDRCITRGMPVSMEPRNYNNGIRIMQSPGYVMIVLEMAHEVRIIPTNGRPALDKSIKEWLGESRGRWDGNTLVVETTNFNGKTDLTNAGVPGSPPLNPASENLKITERFTRTDNDTIDFQMKVEDPEIIESSFTVAYPMKLDNKYQMYEYACHEGNMAIRGYIENSRFERAHPKPPGQTPGRGRGTAAAPAR
ncbi:MAG TPA: hypothetical protein VHZ74_24850 [Bryobacteraceae bacterium]|nr:hypothetical protein [Bryobacteraceae bacterium]